MSLGLTRQIDFAPPHCRQGLLHHGFGERRICFPSLLRLFTPFSSPCQLIRQPITKIFRSDFPAPPQIIVSLVGHLLLCANHFARKCSPACGRVSLQSVFAKQPIHPQPGSSKLGPQIRRVTAPFEGLEFLLLFQHPRTDRI